MAETDAFDLDFTKPPQRAGYNPILARMCFDSHGTEETLAEGGSFFVENQKSDKMYLLVEGEVSLRRGAVAVKKINDGIAPVWRRGIAGRQIDEDVTIRIVSRQIADQRWSVDFDLLERALILRCSDGGHE